MTGEESAALRREVNFLSNETDRFTEELLRQVVAIEDVIQARWPRSMVARWRLARELRRSVGRAEGRTFTEKRIETLASGWLERPPATSTRLEPGS